MLGTIDPRNQILFSAVSTHRGGISKVPASVPTSFPRMLSDVAQKPAVSVSSFLVWMVQHVWHMMAVALSVVAWTGTEGQGPCLVWRRPSSTCRARPLLGLVWLSPPVNEPACGVAHALDSSEHV